MRPITTPKLFLKVIFSFTKAAAIKITSKGVTTIMRAALIGVVMLNPLKKSI
jgi:hypothetical protein